MAIELNKPKLTLKQMLKRLNSMYDREEELIKEMKQLQEDKEMLQTMIMYKANRDN